MAKAERHPGEICPCFGFIVTNMSRPAKRVSMFYNHRGTAEQRIAGLFGMGIPATISVCRQFGIGMGKRKGAK